MLTYNRRRPHLTKGTGAQALGAQVAGAQVAGTQVAGAMLLFMILGAVALPSSASAQKGSTATGTDCTAVAEAVWPDEFTAVAESSGSCTSATLTLSIYNRDGEVVWDDAGPSDQYFGFDEATDTNSMREALTFWVGDYTSISTTSTLPNWNADEDYPVASEFPFYVDEGITREGYLQVRAADRTMICYIQGRESMRCLNPSANGFELETVGVQSFPG